MAGQPFPPPSALSAVLKAAGYAPQLVVQRADRAPMTEADATLVHALLEAYGDGQEHFTDRELLEGLARLQATPRAPKGMGGLGASRAVADRTRAPLRLEPFAPARKPRLAALELASLLHAVERGANRGVGLRVERLVVAVPRGHHGSYSIARISARCVRLSSARSACARQSTSTAPRPRFSGR